MSDEQPKRIWIVKAHSAQFAFVDSKSQEIERALDMSPKAVRARHWLRVTSGTGRN